MGHASVSAPIAADRDGGTRCTSSPRCAQPPCRCCCCSPYLGGEWRERERLGAQAHRHRHADLLRAGGRADPARACSCGQPALARGSRPPRCCSRSSAWCWRSRSSPGARARAVERRRSAATWRRSSRSIGAGAAVLAAEQVPVVGAGAAGRRRGPRARPDVHRRRSAGAARAAGPAAAACRRRRRRSRAATRTRTARRGCATSTARTGRSRRATESAR